MRSNDYFVGRAIFTPLIEVSGSYRKQCFFEASDSEDYFNRRTNQGPTSIHIPEVVSNEFTSSQIASIDAMSEDERLDYIIERSAKDFGRGLALHQCIHDWAIDHPSQKGQIAAENDEPVLAMQEAQRIYVGLAAGHVLVAASLRDYDLTKVPILEPKSITDASSTPLYPIAA